MSQALEPSLVDYARFYGLAVNHLEVDPLVDLPALRDMQLELEDGPQLFKIDTTNGKVPEERLAIGRDEALLLGSLNAASERTSSFEGIELDPHRIRNMKLELPMLRTDHEANMQDFARPVVPDFAREHLPLETVDNEADEGLGWPSECASLPDIYYAECKAEKLDISLDILDHVCDVLYQDRAAAGNPSFELEELPRRKRPSIELVTPPLLPLSPLMLPYEPSSTTGRIQLLSEPISPTLEELKSTDRNIFAKDSISKCAPGDGLQDTNQLLYDSESLGDLYSPLRGIKEPPSSPPIKKASFADLKVEVPLTPPQSDRPPPWHKQNLSLKESICEVIPNIPLPIAKDEEIPSEDVDTFVEKSIAPIAVIVERSIEQEQLQEADTIQRVPVPVMDFSLPLAPWKASASRHERDNTKEELMVMKKTHFPKHHWPGFGEAERSLQWMPFPAALGRVELYECIEYENNMDDYTCIPDCVDSSTLTWKPEGLRLLDELGDTDEEELEDGEFPESNNIEALVRKRKLELYYNQTENSEDDTGPRSHWRRASVNHKAFQKIPRLSPSMHLEGKEEIQTKVIQKNQQVEMETPFSASQSLENFMTIRDKCANKSELTAEHHFPKQQKNIQPNKTKEKDPATTSPLPGRSVPQHAPLPLAAPSFTPPTKPITIILSTIFLRERKLIRHIQRLLPSADFVERDFTLYPPTRQPDPKNNATKSTRREFLANEADLILSPSTGLILTTLQKINQRSLPGQPTKSPLHEHITQTAPRYERLIILIHNPTPTPDSPPPLTQTDCTTLTDFIAFCSSNTSPQTETQVLFTPSDADDDQEYLAHWIASLIAKHCVQDPAIKLLQEETLWEIFLRRAGMNAFAAQVVLAELKAPPPSAAAGEDVMDTGEKYGLAALVEMSLQERLDRFGVLLGGGNVIRRVSRVLDARW
ncbi:MAG: hypothetical protein Q9195_001522 [Heterodermia aff. obscurata]